MVEPIYNAETIITAAVRDALSVAVDTYNGRPKVYYQLADQGAPLPYLVYQLQADISPEWQIGGAGASMLVTVRALASSALAARTLLAAATPYMVDLVYPEVDIQSRYVRSPGIPPQNNVYQSAHIFRISIERGS